MNNDRCLRSNETFRLDNGRRCPMMYRINLSSSFGFRKWDNLTLTEFQKLNNKKTAQLQTQSNGIQSINLLTQKTPSFPRTTKSTELSTLPYHINHAETAINELLTC
jgi:hypothetical protein